MREALKHLKAYLHVNNCEQVFSLFYRSHYSLLLVLQEGPPDIISKLWLTSNMKQKGTSISILHCSSEMNVFVEY